MPIDLVTLLAQLSNPLIAIAGISLLANALPWIADPKVRDWIKVVTIIVMAELWALMLALTQPLPTTPDGWYKIFAIGMSVALGTQIFHTYLTSSWPALGDFLTMILGKTPAVISWTSGDSATSGPSAISISSTTTTASAVPVAQPGG